MQPQNEVTAGQIRVAIIGEMIFRRKWPKAQAILCVLTSISGVKRRGISRREA